MSIHALQIHLEGLGLFPHPHRVMKLLKQEIPGPDMRKAEVRVLRPTC